jgi:hypothetical protein
MAAEIDFAALTIANNYSPEEREHSVKVGALQNHHNRIEAEINAALQAADVEALALLLPKRQAVTLLRAHLEQEQQTIEAHRNAKWHQERRREHDQAETRRVACANRAMSLTHARQLNAKWNFAAPTASTHIGRAMEESRAKARAEYDRLVEENKLENWELAGTFDPQGNWIPAI